MIAKILGSIVGGLLLFIPPEGTLAGIAILLFIWTGKKS